MRRSPGQNVVTADLTAREATVSLGGLVVPTWVYGDSVPGPLLRAKAGDRLRVNVTNALETDTSIHWHGIALSNDMDGVPGITQKPINAGSRFTYEFTAPDPGTYFYHPHTGVQLDRGLYGVLIIDDPDEPGDYDQEWVLVLDDWVDGTGRTPDAILAELQSAGGTSSSGDMDGMDMGDDSMDGMDMGGMGEGMQSGILGGAGDIDYPHYLINGRTAGAPDVLTGKPGQRARIRIVNAASDTAFRVALGGHKLTLTHSDGFPVEQTTTDALMIGMGERYDVTVTLGKQADSMRGVPAHQLAILERMGVPMRREPATSDVVVDALIGYSLNGAPRGRVGELIDGIRESGRRVVSLDTPSGVNVTDGSMPGAAVSADATLTLALPKIGLRDTVRVGELYVADISVPPSVYDDMGVGPPPDFRHNSIIHVINANESNRT